MGSMRDPFSYSFSVFPGGQEFDWFEQLEQAIEWGVDQWGTGPIPMPTPTPRAPVPDVISEIPDTWEAYEEQFPEYFEPILETRPGRTPDPYPQDSTVVATDSQLDKEDEEMGIDWGAAGNAVIDILQGQTIGGSNVGLAPPQARDAFLGPSTPGNQLATIAAVTGGCDGMTWSGGAPPKGYKVVNSCGVGVLRKVRRRRRRRMLTQGDKSDIASIVSMVGKGQLAASLINRSTS